MGHPSSIHLRSEFFNEQTQDFRNYLITIGHKPHGAKVKYYQLKEFFEYLENKGIQEIINVQSLHIYAYHKHIRKRASKVTGEPLHEKTAYDHVHSIKLYFIMLQEKGSIETNPASIIEIKASKAGKERNAYTQAEIDQIYQGVENPKEKIILSLAYGCGLRVGEIKALDITDIRLREKILLVQSGKGNKRRVVPLSPGVGKDLSHYFFSIRQSEEGRDVKAFILNSKGRRMREYTFNKILRELIRRTQNPNLMNRKTGMHYLRHSIATHLIERGVPLEQVKIFLGHSEIETTEIYTHISQKQLNEIKYEKLLTERLPI